MLLAASAARAFDFRAQAPSGQWIYYSVVDESSVKAVNPNWDEHTQPSGLLRIPATATNANNGTTYNVTAIDDNAFKNCADITIAVIPEGVTSIGRMAFAFCTALDSIVLPSTLTYIGTQAFTSTAFFSGNHLTDEGLLIAGSYLIGSRSSLTGTVTVPEGIAGVGNMAFYNGHMDRIELPASLRFIGENAFLDCPSLDTVQLAATVPPTLASNAFSGNRTTILVPCHHGDTYRAAEHWSTMTVVEHCPPDDPGTGITGIATQEPFSVTIVEGGILISNGKGRLFTVIDMAGRRIAQSKEGFVTLPSRGVYIVGTPDAKSTKVVY